MFRIQFSCRSGKEVSTIIRCCVDMNEDVKKYYNTIGAEHFNPELGRKLWTKLIIKNLIKNNIHN